MIEFDDPDAMPDSGHCCAAYPDCIHVDSRDDLDVEDDATFELWRELDRE